MISPPLSTKCGSSMIRSKALKSAAIPGPLGSWDGSGGFCGKQESSLKLPSPKLVRILFGPIFQVLLLLVLEGVTANAPRIAGVDSSRPPGGCGVWKKFGPTIKPCKMDPLQK